MDFSSLKNFSSYWQRILHTDTGHVDEFDDMSVLQFILSQHKNATKTTLDVAYRRKYKHDI